MQDLHAANDGIQLAKRPPYAGEEIDYMLDVCAVEELLPMLHVGSVLRTAHRHS